VGAEFAQGGKILLAAFVISLFTACLYRAVALAERGQGDTAILYVIIGVPGVFSSIILGLALIFGLP
jgi:hypothetical protein